MADTYMNNTYPNTQGLDSQPQDKNLMDWDDYIEDDGKGFITLPEGDYNYKVTSFERSRHAESAKLPACNQAVLYLSIDTPEGTATCRTTLPLYRTLEWKITAFFRSIGMKQEGKRVKMDWNRVPGAKGRAHFRPREYKKDGEKRTANDLAYFIDYDEKFFPENNFMAVPADARDEIPFD